MTNIEKIKNMDVEELAKLVIERAEDSPYCKGEKWKECNMDCAKCAEAWLRDEAEPDDPEALAFNRGFRDGFAEAQKKTAAQFRQAREQIEFVAEKMRERTEEFEEEEGRFRYVLFPVKRNILREEYKADMMELFWSLDRALEFLREDVQNREARPC